MPCTDSQNQGVVNEIRPHRSASRLLVVTFKSLKTPSYMAFHKRNPFIAFHKRNPFIAFHIPKKPGFFKEQNAGFSAQIHRVTLTKTWIKKKHVSRQILVWSVNDTKWYIFMKYPVEFCLI